MKALTQMGSSPTLLLSKGVSEDAPPLSQDRKLLTPPVPHLLRDGDHENGISYKGALQTL